MLILALMQLAAQSMTAPVPATLHEIAPDLVSLPSADRFVQAYPQDAARRNVEGKVQLKCRLTQTGALSDCSAITEDPPGFGFAAAAIRLTPDYRARPPTAIGLAEGAPVSLRLSFYLPRNPGSVRTNPIALSAPDAAGRAEVSCQVFTGRFDNCFVVTAAPKSLESLAMTAAKRMSTGSLPLGLRLILPMTFTPTSPEPDRERAP
jgi:hypothetical protein